MCGIFGIYNFNNEQVERQTLKEMSIFLKHRGPDGEGFLLEKNMGIGHRRLSIIDLSTEGDQPMCYGNDLWITYNGEIYNYLELKKELESDGYTFRSTSDTEVILASYKKYGFDCLQKLRGMFAFCILDKEKELLFIARDRFGIKPVYYKNDTERLIFSSEIKGFYADKTWIPKINKKALYDFLVFNRTDQNEDTCFEDIKHLLPGHYMMVSNKSIDIKTWFNPELNEHLVVEEHVKVPAFKSSLVESVTYHLRSDVPVGAALSGGLDSSTLVSLMRKILGDTADIRTFSAVYQNDWEKDEEKYIKDVVAYTHTNAVFTTPKVSELLSDLESLIYHQEEPFSDTSIFASWCVMRTAHNNGIKVLLSGQGSDEILGYEYMYAYYFIELLAKRRFKKLLSEVFMFWKKEKNGFLFTMKTFIFLLVPKTLQKLILTPYIAWLDKDFSNQFKNQPLPKFMDAKNLNQSVINHLKYKLNHLLRFEDKNSMAFSVESRVPYLDHVFVQQSLKIPSDLKMRDGYLKYILRESMKDCLPENIRTRTNKVGFETPQHIWFKDPSFLDLAEKTINSKSLANRKIFNVGRLHGYLSKMRIGDTTKYSEIWKAICVEYWCRIFIDKSERLV